MCLMVKRFGEALNEEEASKRIKNAVPKTMQYKTHWGIRIFESWKSDKPMTTGRQKEAALALMYQLSKA